MTNNPILLFIFNYGSTIVLPEVASPQCPVNLLYTELCPNIHVLFLHSSLYLSCKLFYISSFSSNHFDTTGHSEILWWVTILSKYLFYLKDNYITMCDDFGPTSRRLSPRYICSTTILKPTSLLFLHSLPLGHPQNLTLVVLFMYQSHPFHLFAYVNVYVSVLLFYHMPLSPSPTESRSLFFMPVLFAALHVGSSLLSF